MTTTVTTFDSSTTEETEAHARKRSSASAVVSAVLACLCAPTLSIPAAAEPFQQYGNASCASKPLCYIDLAQAPAGKRIEIENVSCYLRTSGDYNLYLMALFVGDSEHFVFLAPEIEEVGQAPKTAVYAANHSIVAYLAGGRHLFAFVEWTKGEIAQFACHISGEMLDAAG